MKQVFFQNPWIHLPEPAPLREIYYRYGTLEHLKRGTALINGGDDAKRYLLKKGLIADAVQCKSNKNIYINLIIPGRAIADIGGLTKDIINMDVTVLRDCEVLSLTNKQWHKYVYSDLSLLQIFSQTLVLKMETMMEAMLANLTLNLEDRFKTFLNVLISSYSGVKNGWNTVPIMLSNKEYAMMLSSTNISISRILARWKELTLIDKGLSKKICVHSVSFH